MRRRIFLFIIPVLLLLFLPAAGRLAVGYDGEWDIRGEILRLKKEVPSLEAFRGVSGVVWLSAYRYELMPDGSTRKLHKFLILPAGAEDDDEDGAEFRVFPHPAELNSTLTVNEAGWYDTDTGERLGDLPVESYNQNGTRAEIVNFPSVARGRIAAVETVSEIPRRFFMDDVLQMAGDLPIWEQTVDVEVLPGTNLYWEGVGVMPPERWTDDSGERVTWTVTNQPAWHDEGIVERRRPTLIFSLQKGIANGLRGLMSLENSFQAPPLPPVVASGRSNLSRTGNSIAKYLSERRLDVVGYEPREVRPAGLMPADGPWTLWERVLIAQKWFKALGWDAKTYWIQRMPVALDGPSSMALWDEPVLRIDQSGGKEIYFKPGQAVVFGRLDPSLLGAVIYRVDGSGVERPSIPRGSASDHTMIQTWRLEIAENGIARGTLDLTVTGAWLDALLRGSEPSSADMGPALLGGIKFGVQGLVAEPLSVKSAGSGYMLSYGIKAQLGIASGSDILLRLPGGVPTCFDAVPEGGTKFSFDFPFVFEQHAVISTPVGYRALMLPSVVQNGDSKAVMAESVVHWAKSRRVEASSAWVVRQVALDGAMSARVSEQLGLARRWSETTIPLRK
ncbi:MAG: hypothetical protein LBT08_02715 [Synergistaceae bacterium]|jgi:hypothetical protein|nr:hypothetical protein [Synergistaceae bacterium]